MAKKSDEKPKMASEPTPTAGLSLQDLHEFGAVAESTVDGAVTRVVTNGGVHLRFPGDEAKAATLTDDQLFGAESAAPADAAAEKADELALLGRMTPIERAMHHFGLEQRHVLGSGERKEEDGSVTVTIVTQGGQRVRWPGDAGRVLSDMEKGDAVPQAQPGGVFSKA